MVDDVMTAGERAMSGFLQISSMQNPRIKQLLQFQQKSSERRKAGVFVVEGRRELQHCVEAGFTVLSVFFCPELLGESDTSLSSLFQLPGVQYMEVTAKVYEKIAYRGSTEGVVAEVKVRQLQLEDLALSDRALVVVLESVEKPGNLGAVLRSADASAADAVIICDPLTDLFNPNLIRSSVGAVFSVPCVACSSEQCVRFLQDRGIQILTAQLQDSSPYYDIDMTKSTALVMGAESTGLTPLWRKAANAHIRIPMLGKIDSLNVSVSTAILLFEAVRQRQTLR